MKILLIHPSAESFYGLPRCPAMGITYVATALKQKGLTVDVLDMRLPQYDLRFLKRKLASFRPNLVGISSTSLDFPGAIKVFKVVKRFSPQIKTISGGPHGSFYPKEVMAEKTIDYLVVGEGEETLPNLITSLEKKKGLSRVKGLIYKASRGRVRIAAKPELIRNLDALPFPQWDLFPLDDYKVRGSLTLPLMTSRGCPYNCIFCLSWKIHGKKFRFRSPKNVVDEIENNIEHCDTRNFSILDDNFALDKERALKICQEIIKRKLKIYWMCAQGIRADAVDKKLLRAMKKSGCQLVSLGVESANQDVLNQMKKGETLEVMKRAIKDAKSVGLIVKTFFIVGGPGDNFKKTKKSIQFFKENDVDIPRFALMTAYPYSPMWDWVKKNGRFIGNPHRHILKTPIGSRKVQFETKDFSREERLEAFILAEREAEIWAIRQRLIKKLGPFLGKILVIPFYLNFTRELVKKIYRLRIFSVTDYA